MSISQTACPAAAREIVGFGAVIGLIMLFVAGKAVLFDTLDPDSFWHLRVAEQLQRDGVGPLIDQISFASVKTPWTPYSWLGELGMKWIWDRTGLRGAVATQALLEAAFIMLIAMCCLEHRARDGIDAVSLMPVVVTTAFCSFLTIPYLSFRPVLAANVLLALVTLILLRDRRRGERTWIVWTVPLLTALAINIHIFAVFIPLGVGALFVGSIVEAKWRRNEVDSNELSRRVRRYALLLLATGTGCCCTPMLPGTLATIRDYATTNPLMNARMIAEMQPMYHGLDKQICLAVIGAVIICALLTRQVRMGNWLWLIGMSVLLVRAGRAGTIFVPIFAPVMCASIPRLSDRVLGKLPITITVVLVLLIAAFRVGGSLPDNAAVDGWLNRRGADMAGYPSAAADFVGVRIKRSTGRLINEFDWGGYLAWKLPEFQVMLDGRTQLYTPQFWQATYLGERIETTRCLSEIRADVAIVPAGRSRFYDSLIELGWKQIYHDERAQVMIPPASIVRFENSFPE